MSPTTMYEGLAQCFATIPKIQNIVLGEPSAAHELPCLYTAYGNFHRDRIGQTVTMTHTFYHRLLIAWQDPEQAEAELLELAPQIPIAIDKDPSLDGRIATGGLAKTTDGITGFQEISGTKYRLVEYTTTVIEKGPFPFPPSDYTGEI